MKNKWFKLDNAGKIFPPTSSKKDPKVFRFSCELKEDVNQNILGQALDETIEMFPGFRVVLKKGLFWYYLETTNLKSKVTIEDLPPCSPIYNQNKKGLLFRVTYYNKRINLETYHALSDGTGALEFLKCLVSCYLNILYFKDKKVSINYDASYNEKMIDSFDKYYDNTKKIPKSYLVDSYQIKGEHISDNRIRVVEGHLSVKEVLKKAHEYNATLTSFLTAIYIISIGKTMKLRDKKKPISVVIPVNLRNYFKSATARNFFSTIFISYFSKIEDNLEEIIDFVNKEFKDKLQEEKITERMNEYAVFEHNFIVRLIPLFIKDIVLYIAYLLSEKKGTVSLSNVGKIEIDSKYEKYIEKFSVFSSTYKEQMCICSYLDNLTIASTSSFEDEEIMKNFYRELTNFGISVQIISNIIDE